MKKFSEISTLGQLGIMLGVTVVLVLAGEYFYLSGISQQNSELDGRVTQLKSENEKLRGVEARFKQVKADNERLEAQLANVRHIVPDEKEADMFIRMVQEAGVQAGINIRRFTARPVAAREFYNEMPFELNIDGNYYTVMQFFDRLSKLSRVMNVTNLAIGPTTAGVRGIARKYIYSPNETILSSCTVTSFYSREQGQPAAMKR